MKKNKDNTRLPHSPRLKYSNVWEERGKWKGFLNIITIYETWQDASKAAIKLNIMSSKQYEDMYTQNVKLPKNPIYRYAEDWKKNGGWDGFLNITRIEKYPTWEEASKAAVKLGIKSSRDYKIKYFKDERLPSSPRNSYSGNWESKNKWIGFLQKNQN